MAQCDRIRLVEVKEVVQQADGSEVNRATASRNQYINLDATPGHPEYGRRIRFRARVQWVSGSTRSLSGQTVYWYHTPGGSNRNGLSGALRAGFDSEGSGSLRTTSTIDSAGWTEIVNFYPSRYGGDAFEVFATEDSSYTGGISAGTYTVWRRLSYELDCMTRASGGGTYANRANTADMETKFRGLFIELAVTGTDASPAHQRLVSDTDADTWASNVRDGTGAPRYFHLVLIDTIAWDPAPVTQTHNLTRTRHRIRLEGSRYLLNSANWFVRATYRSGTNHGAVPRGNFTLSEAGDPSTGDDRFEIQVSFNGLNVDLSRPVRIRLTFTNWTAGSGLQTPTGPATIIGMRWRERLHRASAADLTNSTLNTMMHEPGHAMGLAPSNLPDGTANADHYDQAGCHCHALANGCVMYEANSTSVTFCDHCSDGLKARNLSSLPLSGDGAY
jgi:hypothetical protein